MRFVYRLLLLCLACVLLVGGELSAQLLTTNGDFSANAAAYTTFPGYNTLGNPAAPTGWIPLASTSTQGVNGPGLSTPFGPADQSGATDYLFLQNPNGLAVNTQIAQQVALLPNTTYTLSFQAAGRINEVGDGLGVAVNDGSTTVYDNRGPGGTGIGQVLSSAQFQNYVIQFTTTAAASGASSGFGFSNQMTYFGDLDRTVNVSNVSLNQGLVANNSFEFTHLTAAPANNFSEGTVADSWTLIHGATGGVGGLVGNGSAYNNSAPAPDGTQAGLLKADGGFSQSVGGLVPGQQYTVSFLAEGRPGGANPGGGPDPIQVSVGGNVVTFGGASSVVPGGSYTLFTSDHFTATSSTETLALVGTATIDLSSFVDVVNINPVPVPEPASWLLLGLGSVALLDVARRRRIR